VVLGVSAGTAARVDPHRISELVTGIFEDVSAILQSFARGPDDPSSPLTNQSTLRDDAARLDAATRKANELANDLDPRQLQQGSSTHGR
jgi:hypothetical protein